MGWCAPSLSSGMCTFVYCMSLLLNNKHFCGLCWFPCGGSVDTVRICMYMYGAIINLIKGVPYQINVCSWFILVR